MLPIGAQPFMPNVLIQYWIRHSFYIFSEDLAELIISVRLSIFYILNIFLKQFLKDGQFVIELSQGR